jgi:hypothetical protein
MTITSRFVIITTSISASTLVRREAAHRHLQITQLHAIVRDGRRETAPIGRGK